MRTILMVLAVACSVAARGVVAEDGHDGHAHGKQGGTEVKAEAKPAVVEKGAQSDADDGHEGHAHAAASAGTLEERMKATCEHKVRTHLCNACRFEVGFVRVAADLLKPAGNGSPLVRIGTVSRCKLESSIEVTGEVRLNENATVHVTPRISGVIRSVAVDVGSAVKPGDVLLEMESVELGEALAAYLKSRALTELSLRALEREKALFEKKVGTESDLIEAQMRYEEHRADLESAVHKLGVLGMSDAEVAAVKPDDRARLTGRLAIRASLPGIVVDRHASVGEHVEPGADLLLVSDVSQPWVLVDIYERDLAAVLARRKAGAVPAGFEVAAFAGRRFEGKIDHVAAVMNEDSRTVKARAVVPNSDGLLRPGMFCRGWIALGGGDDVIGVSSEAVMSDEGSHFVFRHVADDLYARVAVRKGREAAGVVEILDGIKEGERIVTTGAFLLKSDVLREKMGAGCAD